MHKRPLHPLEILGLMGFPAVPQLSLFGESCSFSSSRELHDLPTQRTRRSVCGQAGNSMYVPQAGMALLFLLFACRAPETGKACRPCKRCVFLSSQASVYSVRLTIRLTREDVGIIASKNKHTPYSMASRKTTSFINKTSNYTNRKQYLHDVAKCPYEFNLSDR